jgi:hypothetical protein
MIMKREWNQNKKESDSSYFVMEHKKGKEIEDDDV